MTSGSRLRFHWKDPHAGRGFSTAVSLHSHTCHSQERLDFIPRLLRGIPMVEEAEAAYRRRFHRENGAPLDYSQLWWTPPLTPVEALRVETRQIHDVLGLKALVSLSDHDTIDAAWGLRSIESMQESVISVEWTVPRAPSFLHLGIHNLPVAHARRVMPQLAAYTATPNEQRLPELLDWLNSWPDTLIVFNHPLWDESRIGVARHVDVVHTFLRRYGRHIHALELNGLRPWRENRGVIRMALESGMPLISGGDRHGFEPNANVNLTRAATFSEFAEEVRRDRASDVLFLSQYRQSHTLRVLETICDVLRHNPEHSLGWTRWTDRVFWRESQGKVQPVSAYWPRENAAPAMLRAFLTAMRIFDSRHVRLAMRAAFPMQQEHVW